MAIALVGL